MQKIILALTTTLLCVLQTSCKKDEKPSILVIAVDQLSSTDINCNQDDNIRSGFTKLCQESVRFTHAYTPSVLSNSALSSLLTGLYPFQHQVRHNGGPGLAPEIELASEVAYRKNYHTSFFSGGPPVFRRSGLNQGFEIFDDNFVPTWNVLFRPLSQNLSAFLQWLDDEVEDHAFFSVLYAPDLLYINTETQSDLGETRNLSFESQTAELDENLFELFSALQERGRWDSTYVFVVGLQGRANGDRLGEAAPLNLHSENTQVALFIKPVQNRKRDQAIHWKVDQNVSLVDIGHTIFELLGESFVDRNTSAFSVTSLLQVLKSPNANWPENRLLLIESGWAFWRSAGPIKTAGISGPVLYIHDEKPLVYNTLVDRFEMNPLPLLQQSTLAATTKLRSAMQKNQMVPFIDLNSEWKSKISIPYSRWVRLDQENRLLQDLKKLALQKKESIDIQNWTAQIALNQRSWEDLKVLGQRNSVPTWTYVAERNMPGKVSSFSHPCFDLLNSASLESRELKACSDPIFLEMIDWLRAGKRGLNKETQKRKFERSFQSYMIDQQVQRYNIAAGFIWDTAKENIFAPSHTELALNLPELAKVRAPVYRGLTSPAPSQ